MKIMITGGAGFIGGNHIHYLNKLSTQYEIVCVDAITKISNIQYIQPLIDSFRVILEYGNIADDIRMPFLIKKHDPDYIIHFAAETHVDKSIKDSSMFCISNVMGTANLLDAVLKNSTKLKKFIHISTDEVYGSLDLDHNAKFHEKSQYKPNNPYAASKAASDHFVRAYNKTFDIPTIITHCSNNYGPGQDITKLIPKIIHNAKNNIPIPLYGDGLNVRDWLHVEDHCRAIHLVMTDGEIGEVYDIGGGKEVSNIDLVKIILKHMNKNEDLIHYIPDRLGHDRRYAISFDKINSKLGYWPMINFDSGILDTIDWYMK